MNFQKPVKIFPGVILALVFCLFSQGVNNLIGIELFGTEKSPISTVMIAILPNLRNSEKLNLIPKKIIPSFKIYF